MQREKLAVRFGNPETAAQFKEAFNAAKDFNTAKKNGQKTAEAPVISEPTQ